MTKYDYRVGTYEPYTSLLSGFISKAMLFTAGGIAGAVGGLYVVVGQIQAEVQPVITQDSSSVLPIVHAEPGKLGVVGAQSFSSPDDLQPASGYNAVQRTVRVQP